MKKMAFFAVLLAPLNALAGQAINQEVNIDGNYAQGVLSAARHSSDNAQFIGCSLYNDQFGNWALCIAEDASGNNIWCETSDPSKLQSIAALNQDSRLSFKVNENSECTEVNVGLNSAYIR